MNKTYRVTVGGQVEDEQVLKLSEGIVIEGKKTLPCDVFVIERKVDRTVLTFVIHEGRNRQVRRMLDAVGANVMSLKRISVGSLTLGNLPEGKWRKLSDSEINKLRGKGK